jgi:hypothetical protein
MAQQPSSEHLYSDEEIAGLLEKAEGLGFSLEAGSELEPLTIRDLDRLVNVRQ